MRVRGQGAMALVFTGAVVLAAVAADRSGVATPAPGPSPVASSTSWICPHGGGAGIEGAIVLMNPGTEPADVRITSIGEGRPAEPVEATVAPGHQLVRSVPATDDGASTLVEAFGAWVGASWRIVSEDPGGLGAEPCLPEAATTWWAMDPGTPQGDLASLIVANPFSTDAVVDVALFAADRDPIRDAEWTDLPLPAMRSVALRVNGKVVGEEAVLAEVVAEVGRVAVASLVMGRGGGIRSAVASSTLSGSWNFPVGGGTGQTTLLVGMPAQEGTGFGVSLLTREPVQDFGGLTDAELPGAAAHAYPGSVAGPSGVALEVRGEGMVAAALRAEGRSIDDGATAGAPSPAATWLVPSTFLAEPWFPGLVIMNPGDRDAQVTLHHLATGGTPSTDERTIAVPAGSAVAAPSEFLEAAPQAAIVVEAQGGKVVALGSSASSGVQGYARYALVLGVPMPTG